MKITVSNKSVPSSDGSHILKGKVYFPEGEVKGYLHIVHGMTEHIGRYHAFMVKMASRGYIVFGFDNLGHGYTANYKSELGFIAHKKGWELLVKDVEVFSLQIFKEYGDKPYYLMGHSMGSFIVRVAMVTNVSPDKVILCGTGYKNHLSNLGIAYTKILKIFKGDKYVSKFLDKVSIGSYNKKFKEEGHRRSWITSDEKLRKKYDNEKLFNFRFGLSAMQDLITLNKMANSNRFYKNIDYGCKVLLVSGKDDPVGKFGKGIEKIYNKLVKNKVDVQMKLYDGRHEIYTEPRAKDQLINDIDEFLSID
ncbi:MAG: alpha/beta hydrolase [Clostridiales bacterium]|nr:alpha/beta hydrolase [Clostridiales bacterium]